MATKAKSRPQQQQNDQSQDKTARQMQKRVEATLKRLEAKDPGLKQLLKKGYGYAVFPSVGKAALVVGGSYGRGAVFEKEKMIGYATISQMTIGVQVGGDTFTEILIFHDKGELKRFKQGRMAFAANASAVLVKAAAAGTSDFKGVSALAYSNGGMLLELSLGGQKFKFKPLGEGGEAEQQGKGAKAKGRAGEAEDDEESDEDQEGEDSGILGRAIGGVKGAASKVTDLAKERPIVATVVGAGLVTGLALLAMRAFRQSDDADSDESQDEEDDDDTEARGSDESEDDESEEEEGDEEENEGDDDDDDEAEGSNHVGGKRSHRYR